MNSESESLVTYRGCEKKTASAAILYPAVCVGNVTNKAGRYGKNIYNQLLR